METFSASWLALREPADHRARAATLEGVVADALRVSPTAALRVVDLGTGAGSNVRHLAPRLPHPQTWTLVDHDRTLLDVATATVPAGAVARALVADLRALAKTSAAVGAGGPSDEPPMLVTGAALLDLVSAPWLEALAAWCDEAQTAVLFALSYDGRLSCEPRDPLDADVRTLVNRHQHTDKGFGPASGPEATALLARALASRGFSVHRAQTDWVLGPEDAALQRELVKGWAGAALALAPGRAPEIGAWAARRLAFVDEGRSRIRVGHEDLAAVPAPRFRNQPRSGDAGR